MHIAIQTTVYLPALQNYAFMTSIIFPCFVYNSHNKYPLLFYTCLIAVFLFGDGIIFFERYDPKLNSLYKFGAQAISPRRLTAEAGVWSWPCPCYVYHEKVALGQVFLLTFQFYIVSDTPPLLHTNHLNAALSGRKSGHTLGIYKQSSFLSDIRVTLDKNMLLHVAELQSSES